MGKGVTYQEREYRVISRVRRYGCPQCGTGELVGYLILAKTHHVRRNRYLLEELVPEVQLKVDGIPYTGREMARFHFYVCTRCRFIVDGPVAWRDHRVEGNRQDMHLFQRHDQMLTDEEGGLPLPALFLYGLREAGEEIGKVDWLEALKGAGLVSDRVRHAFEGRWTVFSDLVRTMLLSDDFEGSLKISRQLDQLLNGRLLDLIHWRSYRNDAVLVGLHLARLLQLAVIYGRENDEPFEVNPRADLLDLVLGHLLSYERGRSIHRSTSGLMMRSALRIASFTNDPFLIRKAKSVALAASDMAIRSGNSDYDDPDVRPDQPEENNEAVRYVNLVLREELGDFADRVPRNREALERELAIGLRRSRDAGRGEGTFAERRACRMGEQVLSWVQRGIGEGRMSDRFYVWVR